MSDTRPIPLNTKVLPCPFCGAIPADVAINIDGTSAWQYVVCNNRECLCDGRIYGPCKDWAVGQSMAIMMWNTRHEITEQERDWCVNFSSSSR